MFDVLIAIFVLTMGCIASIVVMLFNSMLVILGIIYNVFATVANRIMKIG